MTCQREKMNDLKSFVMEIWCVNCKRGTVSVIDAVYVRCVCCWLLSLLPTSVCNHFLPFSLPLWRVRWSHAMDAVSKSKGQANSSTHYVTCVGNEWRGASSKSSTLTLADECVESIAIFQSIMHALCWIWNIIWQGKCGILMVDESYVGIRPYSQDDNFFLDTKAHWPINCIKKRSFPLKNVKRRWSSESECI